jgi:hypothetical protein
MPDPQRGTHRLGRRAKRFLSPSQKGGGHPVQNVSASESNRNNAGRRLRPSGPHQPRRPVEDLSGRDAAGMLTTSGALLMGAAVNEAGVDGGLVGADLQVPPGGSARLPSPLRQELGWTWSAVGRMLPRFLPRGGSLMRYKVGAEQLQQVPTFVHRPDTAFRASRTAPAGPTHAVSTRTGEAACGIEADGLAVLDQDWEQAFFVEKCPGSFTAVLADTCD